MNTLDKYLKKQGLFDNAIISKAICNIKKKDTVKAGDYLKAFGMTGKRAARIVNTGALICGARKVESLDEEISVKASTIKLGHGR